jgi:hypothetical protein
MSSWPAELELVAISDIKRTSLKVTKRRAGKTLGTFDGYNKKLR